MIETEEEEEEEDSSSSSWDRAQADVELIRAAYPDETESSSSSAADNDNNESSVGFPLHVTFRFTETAYCELELKQGYPVHSNVGVSLYRCAAHEKARMEAVCAAIAQTSQECQQEGMEGGLACCAAALEAWNNLGASCDNDNHATTTTTDTKDPNSPSHHHSAALQSVQVPAQVIFQWTTGQALQDRKSTFQAHVCRITSEQEVPLALQQLMDQHTKLHRASHNMYAWRLRETLDNGTVVWKHDNEDDGEDAAGGRLAQLLELRHEEATLVVVSRWFGGIHLGPKRFAHITNVARQVLVDWHEAAAN